MSEDKISRRSFFTPCRTVGLKRKSIGTPSLASPAQNSLKATLIVRNSEECSSTPKRVKENTDGSTSRDPKTLKTLSNNDENEETSIVEGLNSSVNTDTKQDVSCSFNLEKEICETELRINKLKEEISNLESVSLNAKQHDRNELNKLIRKWRNACQQALNDLLTECKNRDNTSTMSTLLSTLGIPPSLVHYSEAEMDFYE